MNIYQHFRKEEWPFIDHVLSWKETVSQSYVMKTLDFLDPREQDIVRSVIGQQDDVRVHFWGGTPHSERKRGYLLPPYKELDGSEYGITLFDVQYASKFVTIDHRQLLGSCMSLGVKREKFGDFLVKDETVQLVVAEEISEYIKLNLQSVGKASVQLEERSLDEMLYLEEQWIEHTCTVSSLRIDTVVSEIVSLSRSKATELLSRGRVKVNWRVVDQSSFSLTEHDHLSIRGYGRFKLLAIDGETKKGKLRIRYGKKVT